MNLQQLVVSSISSSVETLILTDPTKSGSSHTSAGWQTKSVHKPGCSWPVTTRMPDAPTLTRTQEKPSSSRFVVFRGNWQTQPVREDLTSVEGIVVMHEVAPILLCRSKTNKWSLVSRKVQASCRRPQSVDFNKREVKLARAGNFTTTELLMWTLICTGTLPTLWSPPSQGRLQNLLWLRRRTLLRNHASPKCRYE